MTLPKEQIERQMIDLIRALPPERAEAVLDFAQFLLTRERTYSAAPQTLLPQETSKPKEPSSFLLAIAGLGASDEGDVAEQDEVILAAEIDPIRGWSLRRDESAS